MSMNRLSMASLLFACIVPVAMAAAAAPLSITRIAQGIYVHFGAQADPNPHNHGDIANLGFIVGKKCVAVIDSGGSPLVGGRFLAAIHKATTVPVCYMVNTHMHPDHVMGNRVFARATRARFIAAARFPAALAARASTYLQSLSRELDQQPDSSWIRLPDISVAKTKILDLGGRMVRLRAWPPAHTNNDLTVYDETTHTLFAGDLLFVNRVPSLDGSITGWIKATRTLACRTDIKRMIPGHGPIPTDWRKALAVERGYFTDLSAGIRHVLDTGGTLEDAVSTVGQDQHSRWLLFNDYNKRNVTTAYAELEWQ